MAAYRQHNDAASFIVGCEEDSLRTAYAANHANED